MDKEQLDKLAKQKKESWIKNVVRIQNISQEEAEKLYDKIKPFRAKKAFYEI